MESWRWRSPARGMRQFVYILLHPHVGDHSYNLEQDITNRDGEDHCHDHNPQPTSRCLELIPMEMFA